jgi:hypothetical protein
VATLQYNPGLYWQLRSRRKIIKRTSRKKF